MNILVSAFACNPDNQQLHPGEDIVGWKLVNQLARFFDLWVISHEYNRKTVLEFMDKNPKINIRFHFVSLPKWLKILYKIEFGQRIYYYLWQIRAWLLAKKLHRQVGFKAAHHLTFGNDWIPSFIGAFLPVPFIWGPIGGGQNTPKELFKEYTAYGRFAERMRRAAQWMGRHLWTRSRCAKRADVILVCNRETKEKFAPKYHDKIQFFPVNGIEEEEIYDGERPERKTQNFQIMTAGRLHRLKGFAIAIKAFASFCQNNPMTEFCIVGSGPERETLERLSNSLNLNSKIRFIPWLKRDKLMELMRASDVFLFPSFRDGGGAVVVEAMAQALPVICLDSGGPGFHIQDDWGIKIEIGKRERIIEDISTALLKIQKDPNFSVQIGRRAKDRAKEYYVWDRLGERMHRIYEKVMRPGS